MNAPNATSRSVLITGASSGIGAATARRLSGRGFRVFGTSRKPPPEDEQTENRPIEWVRVDVREESSLREAAAFVMTRCARLDGLVCNAGYGIFGSIEEVSIERAREQFETNYFGTLRTLRAFLPHLRAERGGRIVLVGSLAAHAPIPFQSHYSSSKAALAALALGLRNEVRSSGISVSLVEPGDTNTPFNDATQWQSGESSVYGESIRRCEQAVRDLLPQAPDPDVVARVIERALTARRPRVRYSAGADALLAPFARRFLPDWITLAVLRSRYHL